MTLVLVSFLVFIATASLALAGFYFLIQEPAERRRLRKRLEALEESSSFDEGTEESQILRDIVLSRIPKVNAFLLRIPAVVSLHIVLRQAGTEWTAARLLTVTASLSILSFVLGMIMRFPFFITVLLACFVAGIPFAVLRVQRHRRLSKFAEQFPDAIDLLARAVRAGHAFTTGLDLIAQELSEPVAGEFRTIYDQQNLGLSIRDALANLAIRAPLPDVRIFVSALQVQRESGGNLAEILDNLSDVIRERFKLQRQVRVITAEGRLSLYALTALPFVAALAFLLTNPSYIAPLYQDPLGHWMVAGALVLQLIGYAVISKIVRIKI